MTKVYVEYWDGATGKVDNIEELAKMQGAVVLYKSVSGGDQMCVLIQGVLVYDSNVNHA